MKRELIRGDLVFVDANTIIESHRMGCWTSLVDGYRLETVEDCVIETQTGFQLRRESQEIDEGRLRQSLVEIHGVDRQQRMALQLRIGNLVLDQGELSLWAHLVDRVDCWYLCGPDKASMVCGLRLGCADRIVSLQTLLDGVGFRSRKRIRRHYTQSWQEETLAELRYYEQRECPTPRSL